MRPLDHAHVTRPRHCADAAVALPRTAALYRMDCLAVPAVRIADVRRSDRWWSYVSVAVLLAAAVRPCGRGRNVGAELIELRRERAGLVGLAVPVLELAQLAARSVEVAALELLDDLVPVAGLLAVHARRRRQPDLSRLLTVILVVVELARLVGSRRRGARRVGRVRWLADHARGRGAAGGDHGEQHQCGAGDRPRLP